MKVRPTLNEHLIAIPVKPEGASKNGMYIHKGYDSNFRILHVNLVFIERVETKMKKSKHHFIFREAIVFIPFFLGISTSQMASIHRINNVHLASQKVSFKQFCLAIKITVTHLMTG